MIQTISTRCQYGLSVSKYSIISWSHNTKYVLFYSENSINRNSGRNLITMKKEIHDLSQELCGDPHLVQTLEIRGAITPNFKMSSYGIIS